MKSTLLWYAIGVMLKHLQKLGLAVILVLAGYWNVQGLYGKATLEPLDKHLGRTFTDPRLIWTDGYNLQQDFRDYFPNIREKITVNLKERETFLKVNSLTA